MVEASGGEGFLTNHLIAGALGGGLSTLALHPLDLLKTRSQVGFLNRDGRYESLLKNISYIYTSRGIAGYYQGATPNVIGNLVSWGTNMFAFRVLGSEYKKRTSNENIPMSVNYCFAFLSGLSLMVITNPIWVLKVRMCMNDGNGPYKTLVGSIKEVYKNDKIYGFYKGLAFGFVSCIHGAIFLSLYDKSKESMRVYLRKAQLDPTDCMCASAFSKIIANFATYPSQVFRSRFQNFDACARYQCLTDVITKTLRNEGIVGLYKGLIPSTLRVLPSACLNIYIYERSLAFLNSFNDSNRPSSCT